MYKEFNEICMICSYKSRTHFVQIWMELQFRYEPLLDGVSAYAERVTNYFAIFSEGGGHILSLLFIYKL